MNLRRLRRASVAVVAGAAMLLGCARPAGPPPSAAAPPAPPAAAPATAPGASAAPSPPVGSAAPAAPASAASAPSQPAAAGPLAPPVSLRLGIFGSLEDAGLYVALERGYFEAEGLNVDTVQSESAPKIIPFLASGDVEVAGLSQSPALFNAVERGVPIKLVADKGHIEAGHDDSALVLRPDLAQGGAVQTIADLRGRRISTPGRGTALWGMLARGLATDGLTLADVDLQELSQPDSLPALANGALDAAMLLEPFISAVSARGIGVKWKGTSEFAPGAQNGELAYAPRFIQTQPEAARRFLVAYLKGVRDYRDAFDRGADKEAIIDVLVKRTPVKDRALYATMSPVGLDPNGQLAIAYLASEQELYAREGLLTSLIDVASLVDSQYADYAVAQLGRR
ncbi:MAG TPA: ABC transporter substrate-binding protein [Chloroflexota bacterium]|jgi:NitT/TauT family transport system substrate-binding protein